MALPKGMRVLAALTMCIFFYLFLQILRAPAGEMQMPEKVPGSTLQEWDHDPQLDCTWSLPFPPSGWYKRIAS